MGRARQNRAKKLSPSVEATLMVRYVSIAWNVLFLGLAVLTVFIHLQRSGEVDQVFAEYGITLSGTEQAYAVLLASSIYWLILLIIWALGALLLWPFKSAARRKTADTRQPANLGRRHEPKL
jgi:hypothetical protein